MTGSDDATYQQIRAANPVESTWLSANAGSGKTRVLTDRVARLLLHEVDPQRILCLTYTKAAATEMQNRLFRRLGAWAMMPDDPLRKALAELGESATLDTGVLQRARQLFARAIDTPGGLRIQTIHSFCAALLRRFPLESGVSPQFTEMDDRAAQLLQEDILEDMADGIQSGLVRDLAGMVSEGTFPTMIKQIVSRRAGFTSRMDRSEMLGLFGLPPNFDEAGLLAEVFLGDEAGLLLSLRNAMHTKNVGVRELRILAGIRFDPPGVDDLQKLERAMLRQDNGKKGLEGEAKIGDFPPKDLRTLLSNQMPQIEDLMRRVEAARPRRLALKAVDRTTTLHAFAHAFLVQYKSRKDARGWLDFDDLIQHARGLLTDPGLAAWVLYRLDGGIDHILVDEAQDTSPDQWQVIQSLTDEFFAGDGKARKDRTLFVVGDKKQSIYSFQGADLLAFDRMHQHFNARISAAGLSLEPGLLRHSFRSSTNILRLVDIAFGGDAGVAIGGNVEHAAFHVDQPGRIDLWPPIAKSTAPEDNDPFDPVDILGETSAQVQLATKIAREIKSLLDAGTMVRIGGKDRALHAGDILILVQRRSPLFAEIIRACKNADLPIAGADRLKLGAEVAVKDLAALLSFLATPEDDLALATVLRSPLCGLTEADLFALAQPRKGYLWAALRDASDRFGTVNDMLMDLRAQADFLRPYDIIDRVLSRHDGRRRLLARLGPEAEDGIDELLQQALAHERREVPSLTSFLVALQTDDVEIKRQADGAGRRIRVMTVHGAKGLEAPVVILPDSADYEPPDRDRLVPTADGSVFDRPAARNLPPFLKDALAQRKARQAEERMRLLYVALTRAQSWLIVAAAGVVSQPTAWHQIVSDAMVALGSTEKRADGFTRHSWGDWPDDLGHRDDDIDQHIDLPDWVDRPAPQQVRPMLPVSPSLLGGAKALPGEGNPDPEQARLRGLALHLLLEHLPHLPPGDQTAMAQALVRDPTLLADIWREVSAILDDASLSGLFGANSLAEVPIVADLSGRRLFGTIDRLIVQAGHVLAVDFKSNQVIPDSADAVPDGILCQMGAYAEALAQIYPGHVIDLAVLWTAGPRLMRLDRDIVRMALARATIP